MKINYRIFQLNDEKKCKQLTLALGNFSCFHLGHLTLINKTIEVAKKDNTISALLTFKNEKYPKLIMSEEDKKQFLQKLGIDMMIVVDFNDDLKNTSYLDFIKFLQKINVLNVVVGEDFHFGKDRLGTIKDLQNNFATYVLPLMTLDYQKISTKDIIGNIENGNIKTANRLLGFNYTISGLVQEGLHNGHRIGFPTINLSLKDYIMPLSGVYSAYLNYQTKKYLGMAYIGTHQTVDGLSEPILEIHVFDFDLDIYHELVQVELLERINDDFKFDNLDELKSALKKYKSTILEKYSAVKE